MNLLIFNVKSWPYIAERSVKSAAARTDQRVGGHLLRLEPRLVALVVDAHVVRVNELAVLLRPDGELAVVLVDAQPAHRFDPLARTPTDRIGPIQYSPIQYSIHSHRPLTLPQHVVSFAIKLSLPLNSKSSSVTSALRPLNAQSAVTQWSVKRSSCGQLMVSE